MKHYKLAGWPDLPVSFHRTAYRRMLHQMSHRHVSVQQLMAESGLSRGAVQHFLDRLNAGQMLDEREEAVPDSGFGPRGALGWLRRALLDERTA